MSVWVQLVCVWCFAAAVQGLAWAGQQRSRNAGVVDVVWSLGVAAAAAFIAASGSGGIVPRVLVGVLGAVWGLRLGTHLWQRTSVEPEDGRYAQLRQAIGNTPWKWFMFFQFQALLIVLFAMPFLAVAANPQNRFGIACFAAVGVWLISVAGEALADHQLRTFRANPQNAGKTCRTGLWRYSRHPNYFFEWLHWFTYVLLAWGAPLWWLACAGPIVMYIFLRWLSGIPWTEAQSLRTRGADYANYQRTTPMLFPWFPKDN